jgi:hypothetical protein
VGLSTPWSLTWRGFDRCCPCVSVDAAPRWRAKRVANGEAAAGCRELPALAVSSRPRGAVTTGASLLAPASSKPKTEGSSCPPGPILLWIASAPSSGGIKVGQLGRSFEEGLVLGRQRPRLLCYATAAPAPALLLFLLYTTTGIGEEFRADWVHPSHYVGLLCATMRQRRQMRNRAMSCDFDVASG